MVPGSSESTDSIYTGIQTSILVGSSILAANFVFFKAFSVVGCYLLENGTQRAWVFLIVVIVLLSIAASSTLGFRGSGFQ